MTNEQVAKYYASLPKDEVASVPIIDIDTEFIDEHILDSSSMVDHSSFDGDEIENERPSIIKKW